MAFRRRRGAKKVRRAVKRRGVRKFGRKRRGMTQLSKDNHAVCSERTAASAFPSGSVVHYDWALSTADYIRAQTIAENYQEFKIDYVEVTVKPYFDTFANSAGSVGTVPQLYTQFIENGNYPGGLAEMKHNGVNPRPMDKHGNITYRFKPSVVVVGNLGGYTIVKKTPWMNTQNAPTVGVWVPNQTKHYGLSMYIDASVAGNYATIETEVHFRFRKPMYPTLQHAEPQVNFNDLPRIDVAH